jgi:hypothetical protein
VATHGNRFRAHGKEGRPQTQPHLGAVDPVTPKQRPSGGPAGQPSLLRSVAVSVLAGRGPGFQRFCPDRRSVRRPQIEVHAEADRARLPVSPCHSLIAVAYRSNKKALMQGFFMGGTGLEPAAPSLSTWCSRSRQFAGVRSSSMVKRNPSRHRTPERRERTLILAILATRPQPSRLVLSSKYPFDSAAAIPAAHTRKAVATQEPTSSRHTNKPSEGWNIRTRRLSDRKPVCVTSSRARSLHNQRSQRSTHEHPLDHPDRRPCARPAWLFRSRPLLGIGLRHA